jgi:hypothetical protein
MGDTLFSEWICDYCGRPEAECVAAREGHSITLVDLYARGEEDS